MKSAGLARRVRRQKLTVEAGHSSACAPRARVAARVRWQAHALLPRSSCRGGGAL